MDESTGLSSNTLLDAAGTIEATAVNRSLIQMNQKLMPREALARNVRYLMDKSGMTETELERASGVSQKTINNVLWQRTSVTLDNVDKLASVWGLSGWQLIIPNLPDELIGDGSIAKIFRNYITSSTEGRKHIEMVAEREAAYTVNTHE